MNIQPIHPDYLHRIWPVVALWLENGLVHSGGEYNVDQLKVFVQQGRHVLLTFVEDDKIVGAFTVCFEDYPNARIAFVSSIGGRSIADLSALGSFSEWCRDAGCTAIRGAVRPSVARLTKKFGFEQRYIIVEQSL
jgi:hypothetical protein